MMKKKQVKRLLCLLLSGILFATNPELLLYASEGGAFLEEESSQQEIATDELFLTEEDPAVVESQTEETSVPDVEEDTKDIENTDSTNDTEFSKDIISTELSTEEEAVQSESDAEQKTESSFESNIEDQSNTNAFPTYSKFVINPLYKDLFDSSEVTSDDETLQSSNTLTAQDAAGIETFQNVQQMADYVRSQMVERSDTIQFYIPTALISSNEAFSALVGEVVDNAIAYTENCSGQEGDALRWVYQKYGVNSQYDTNTGNYLITYTMSYYTTHEQELELTEKVNIALESLNLQGKTDYQKIKLIHDYICDNVDYDYTYSKYSAYDALCTGTAVCQGYAVLFYRMCKEAGLSVRVISGIGNGGAHGWNIVRLGVNYYNIDCTWDGQDTTTRHTYFLLNEADFADHTRGEEYATEAFYEEYPMAAVSYVDESGFDDPLNLANLNFSFTTLDGNTVSSTADGKPKLLIFFRVGCYNSQSTIKSLAENGNLADVDIYAVEMEKNSKDSVSAFKDTYGSDDIVFSYDTSDGNENSMWSYMRSAGLVSGTSYSATLPVICYIDANNQLQYITQGLSNASAIKSNLVYYCNASVPVETYTITYVLNGGTNNSANPTTYQSTSGTINLQDPVREGYVFEGWYIDSAYTVQITQIDKGNSGDIRLYAKWKESASLSGGRLNLDNPECSFTTIDEDTVTSTADGKPKLLVFFSSNCGNSRQTILGIAQNNFSDADIYAVEVIGSTKETVSSFKSTYGNDEIVFCYDTSYSNQFYLNKYIDLAQFEGMTMPIICYIDANNKFQFITEGYSSADTIRSNMDTYCNVEDSEKDWSITYILNGGTNDNSNPTTYRADSATIVLKAPTREGYTFAGWYKDADFLYPVTQLPDESTGNLTLYAKWERKENPPTDGDTPQIDMTIAEGNILMGFPGAYYTETAEKILNRLNAIRLEACEQGVTNPNTGLPLTEADYVPLQWSADLEAITRVRAAEATVAQSHTRPNGNSCFTVKTTSGQQSWAENLAWNNTGLMGGIEQWYSEKSAWVNQTGETTGHYTSIINPRYGQVAVSAFRLTSGGWYAVAQEFGFGAPTNEEKDTTSGNCVQYMEVQGSAVTSLEFEKVSSPYMEKGDTVQLSLNATVTYEDYYGASKTFTGPVKEGGIWNSSDESIASVDTAGLVTAKQAGAATIIVTAGTESATMKCIVYEQQELVEYTVSYDVQGHGTTPPSEKVKAGATLTQPQTPIAEGYVFEGWYQDTACTIPWNFDTDFVQTDTVLYAKWLIADDTNGDIHIQEIVDVVYTGKPCKPTVSVYDGETLLKINKDYTISYHNNINVNTTKKKGSGAGVNFSEALPYVKIIGKGNYTNDALSVNFNILPAALSDAQGNLSAGVKLQYTEQAVVSDKKPIMPFGSIKFGKAMKLDEDYRLSLKTITAFDETGKAIASGEALAEQAIPVGYTGSFALTITGIGNYTGTLEKTVYVADKEHLLKNAKITLGKQLKNISYKDYTGTFTPAYYDKEAKTYYLVENGKVTTKEADAANVYTVSCGGGNLIYGQDFDVIYENDEGAGKAQMTIIGKGQYVGTKSAPFQIMGIKLSAASVMVTLNDKTYTGKALTQNEVALIPKDTESGTPLRYGYDYTISYKKNVNKGKASMTFTALQGSPYSGSFTQTFQINAADLSDTTQVTQADSMKNIVAEYEKSGAKPLDQVVLTNAAGIRLENGRDYTVSYVNNTSVTKVQDAQSAMLIIKGKGNYAGTLEVPFTITKGVLDNAQITIPPVAYNSKKASDYAYQPSVKIKHYKSALNAKTDYEVTYEKNTQADYEAYLEKCKNATATNADRPRVTIRAKEDSNYTLADPSKVIEIPLPIYEKKLTKKNLYVVVEDAVYTGVQVTPNVKVYYSEDPNVVKEAKDLTKEQEILALGFVKLTPNTDYTLSYGANIAAGKNKGSVKISGMAPWYGGDITIKFTIQGKKIIW